MSVQSPSPPAFRPRYHTVSEDEAGQRIDNFLHGLLRGVPRSRVYRMLRSGEVRVNRGRIRPDYRLRADDSVRIPPVRESARPAPGPLSGQDAAMLEDAVLYEDEGLLILDKPSGMAVHGGSGIRLGVIEALRQLRPNQPCLELVHRLDRETSGVLMIAKRRSMLRRAHAALREGRVRKEYVALLGGDWRHGRRRMDAPLVKRTGPGGERRVSVAADGRPAVTEFVPKRHFDGATLMRVILGSGRTHQIRVHAQHAGHPVAGDDRYGDRDFNRRMRESGLRRLFLHAREISFQVPETGQKIRAKAMLPADLRAVLARLEEK